MAEFGPMNNRWNPPETENGRVRERAAILGELIAMDPEDDERSCCWFCGKSWTDTHDSHFENCLWWRAVQVGASEA